MKVGIISFNKYTHHLNYGAALHSYAFQTYLSNHSIDSIIIDYTPKNMELYSSKLPILNERKFWHYRYFIKTKIRWSIGFFSNIRKYNKFHKFFREYYFQTQKRYKTKQLLKSQDIPEFKDISLFVCESDVIWKIHSTGKSFDRVFFLNFPSAHDKIKVAYAPSIGAEPFDDLHLKEFIELTKDFHGISVRENQGAEYLSNILKINIPWLLDPTLLLKAADYDKISILPNENNYLLVYNCIINDKVMLKEATLLAKEKNLKLIEISSFSENKLYFNHTVLDDIGIEEFLGYFKHASFIICNAFHGCCFSIIYEKDFFLFLRDSSDYRMKNITDSLGLSDRLIHYQHKHIPSDFAPIDYKMVNQKLNSLRNKSHSFIEQYITSNFRTE